MSEARNNVIQLIRAITKQYGYTPLAAKGKERDPREPGLTEKVQMERKLALLFKRRFGKQRELLQRKLDMYFYDRKGLTEPPPLDDLWDDEDDIAELIAIILKGITGGIELLGLSLNVDTDWTMTNSHAAKAARKYAYDLIKDVDNTTRKLVKDAVVNFIETPGMTIGDIMDQISSTGFSEARQQRIAITETTRAYAQGERMAAEDLRKEYPDLRVTKTWLTTMDDRNCEICMQNENKEVDMDDTFPSGDMEPPAHVNCVLPDSNVHVFGDIQAAAKSYYDGLCIEISTEFGNRVAVTENHPILTNRGWIRAGDINESDYLFSTGRNIQRMSPAINPDIQNGNSAIQDIFSSLKMSGLMRSITMPVTPIDFNGDGKFIKENIEVIYKQGLLLSNGISEFTNIIGEDIFNRTDVSRLALNRNGMFYFLGSGLNPSFCGNVSICKHGKPIFRSSFAPSDIHTVRNITRGNTGLQQSAPKSPAIDTSLARKFLLRFPGHVSLDKVFNIRDFNFSGHVYDLQSDKYELYTCNNIITHNCRCWISYRTRILG